MGGALCHGARRHQRLLLRLRATRHCPPSPPRTGPRRRMKLPRDLHGDALASHLIRRWDFEKLRQTGSHIVLRSEAPVPHTVSIPAHKPVKLGTLKDIWSYVAHNKGVRIDDILRDLQPSSSAHNLMPIFGAKRATHNPFACKILQPNPNVHAGFRAFPQEGGAPPPPKPSLNRPQTGHPRTRKSAQQRNEHAQHPHQPHP